MINLLILSSVLTKKKKTLHAHSNKISAENTRIMTISTNRNEKDTKVVYEGR